MPNRVKISTKTTRNKEFNSYQTGSGTAADPYIYNTVTQTTTTKINPNIKLLDVSEAIKKTGSFIAKDAANNTVLIELSLRVDHETALRLYDYSLGNIPDPALNPKGFKEYMHYKELLESSGISYDTVKNWITIYDNSTWLNKDAGIIFNSDAKYQIFGAPEQVVLNNRQHYNNCGIESTLNTLAMAGIIKMNENLKDQEKVEKAFLKAVWDRNLAGDSYEIGVLNREDGGTMPDDYRDIMEYYGISSKSYYITTKSNGFVYPKAQIKEMAYKISLGYGAVIGVSSDMLWKNAQSESGGNGYKIDHAIAITGVVYADGVVPSKTADPAGFFIHDTGAWMTKFISYDEFIDATLCDYVGIENDPKYLSCLRQYDSRLDTYIAKEEEGIFITLTDEPIKVETFNLNVTGDKYANILWGNNSDNVVKGMKGNDTLYGRGGNDKIYGGNGNDVIVGNEALDIEAKYIVGLEEKTFEFDTVADFKKYLDSAGVDIGTRLDNLDFKEIKPAGTFDDLLEMYKYIQSNVPEGINTIDGGAGNDIIIGGEQADLIYGGKGNDYIYGGDGRNAIYGGANNDVIVGGYDNDRLFGDAGNDVIYGLDDYDVIDGGAGNDHLWGGKGPDSIETGKGNDTVYFEGTQFGLDNVYSKAGSTIFRFVADGDTNASKITDFFYSLEVDKQKGKTASLNILYKQAGLTAEDSGASLADFYTIKSGKTKSLYLDSDTDGLYNVSVSEKANATVANTKTTGKTKIFGVNVDNSQINNVLITTYEGANITTSTKNDIVTMMNNGNPLISGKVDNIKYTGGKDKYVSEDRDTLYNVGALTDDTNLSIYDNVVGLTKVITDDEGEIIETVTNFASTDDVLYTSTDALNLNLFFDVQKGTGTNGYTTSNTGFYILNNTNMTESIFTNIANGNGLDGGFIYMDSFLGYDKVNNNGYEIVDDVEPAFFGNGRIEHIYCDNTEFEYTESVANIASAVAGWLANSTYTSAFEVFTSGDETSIDALAQIYAAQGNPS